MSRAIMIQGTMSNVGKSLITAGLCRIFKQDGFTVAPFKSQNMALNSYITREGLEIGRAQAMQAEACGLEPEADMNPILLKPSSDTGSQIILNGNVIGNMSAKEYFRRKKEFIPHIMDAYGRLAEKHDIIVIEGAGSPAEINLKADDIVNMGMAKMAKAPVLLVGDIDRGGVFAQLIGTLTLLDDDELSIVKGLIVNKFRGDYSILEPGIKMLEVKSRLPVAGSLPFIELDIDDEDSLSERFYKSKEADINIAVIKFPRISNFTDIAPFERVAEINVKYVTKASEVLNPDMVILPGTKNTPEDLVWLERTGIKNELIRLQKNGTIIFGICGGFQMLGEGVTDNFGIEKKGIFTGLNMLNVSTEISETKTKTNVTGTVNNIGGMLSALSGKSFLGYEIHMGTTKGADAMNQVETIGYTDCVKQDGAYKGNVYGTYVHGFFDSAEILNTVAEVLLRAKGIDKKCTYIGSTAEYKNSQYNKLADMLRKHLNMDLIYKILETGI